MIKKLKSRGGLTLTELMITLLLMSMFSAACLIGITTSLKTRSDNIKIGDADMLGSMVQQIISNELRLCKSVVDEFPADSIKYTCGEGAGSDSEELSLQEGRLVRRPMMGNLTDYISDKSVPMLNDAAYAAHPSSNVPPLRLDNLTFEKDDYLISCSFEIIDDETGNFLKKVEFVIALVNLIP